MSIDIASIDMVSEVNMVSALFKYRSVRMNTTSAGLLNATCLFYMRNPVSFAE